MENHNHFVVIEMDMDEVIGIHIFHDKVEAENCFVDICTEYGITKFKIKKGLKEKDCQDYDTGWSVEIRESESKDKP